MRTSECCAKKVLPFTVNLNLEEERRKLDQLGSEIALKEGLHYTGYTLYTGEPYSTEQARATLYFN